MPFSRRSQPISTNHNRPRQSRIANVSGKIWSGREDLNLRPLGPEPSRPDDFSEENDVVFGSPNYPITIRPPPQPGIAGHNPRFAATIQSARQTATTPPDAIAAASPRASPSRPAAASTVAETSSVTGRV